MPTKPAIDFLIETSNDAKSACLISGFDFLASDLHSIARIVVCRL